MSGTSGPPDDLRELEAALSRIRFHPRESLGPEVIGRLRHGERLKGVALSRFSRPSLWAIAAGILVTAGATAGALVWMRDHARAATHAVTQHVVREVPRDVTVDRCCFDFDGGGRADDGVLVVSRRGGQVQRIAVYEDRDGSRSFTAADVVRFERGPVVAVSAGLPKGAITRRQCCSDLDGAGPADDGLFLVTVPPDRVTLAALYERSPGALPTQLPLR
jgi:hypothetical protein